MGDTDYDRGWDAGYFGAPPDPPYDVKDRQSWYDGYDDGCRQAKDDVDWYAEMWV